MTSRSSHRCFDSRSRSGISTLTLPRQIEDAMKPLRYLIFYLAGGFAAMVAQIAASPGSTVPELGASGAIAAVMGAFLVTYPRDKIRSLLVLFIFVTVTLVPASLLNRLLVPHPTLERGHGGIRTDRRSGVPGARRRLHLRGNHGTMV
jgi:hypothetical protein